jgi:homoserine kinase
MQRIRITLPATVTHLGPSLDALALAVRLHAEVEITERTDHQLIVETEGEGAGEYGVGLRHPVVLGMLRVFQHEEHAHLGLNIRVRNAIPIHSGLGARNAFLAAGVIAANNLLGGVFTHEGLRRFAAGLSPNPAAMIATLAGGLTAAITQDESLLYSTLPVTPFKLILTLPDLPDYARKTQAKAESVSLEQLRHNMARLPLLQEALRTGDLHRITALLDDKIHHPGRLRHIPAWDHVTTFAKHNGALGFSLCGDGPAFITLAESHHERIAEAITFAFKQADVSARTWVIPVDTQGVVISVAQSA